MVEVAEEIFASGEVSAEVAVAVQAGRDEAWAVRAAVATLELTEEVVTLSPEEAVALQRPSSTRAFVDEAAARTAEQMAELTSALPGGIRLRLAPIAVRSEPAGPDWVVSIWYVSAITIGTDAVVDDWQTVTYRMRWEDDAWRIDDFDGVRGPTPGRGSIPASAPVELFEQKLAGFGDEGLL